MADSEILIWVMPKPACDDEKDIVVDEERGKGGEGGGAVKAEMLEEYWSQKVWVVLELREEVGEEDAGV